MGFWETAGKVAQGTAKAVIEKTSEWQEIKDRLEGMSSEELKRLINSDGFFSSVSDTEKTFAKSILRKRGDI